jgi:hypothetical protein
MQQNTISLVNGLVSTREVISAFHHILFILCATNGTGKQCYFKYICLLIWIKTASYKILKIITHLLKSCHFWWYHRKPSYLSESYDLHGSLIPINGIEYTRPLCILALRTFCLYMQLLFAKFLKQTKIIIIFSHNMSILALECLSFKKHVWN